MDIVAAITTTTAALKIVREVRELDAAFDKAVLRSQMVDLMDKLSDVKVALIDAQDELREKDAALAKAKSAFETKASAIWKSGFLYMESPEEPGEPYGYPYCKRCDEVDGRLVTTANSMKERGCVCPQCKAVYIDPQRYLLKSERG